MAKDSGLQLDARKAHRERPGVFCLSLALCVLTVGTGCQKAGAPATGPGAYPFAQLQVNNVDNEVKWFEQRVKQRPDSYVEKVSLAQAYLNKAQSTAKFEYYGLAEKQVQDSLKIYPHNSQAELILASILEARHDFKGAYDISKKIYDNESLDVGARSMLASSEIELGKLAEAEAAANGLLQQWPTSPSATLVARCRILEGRDGEAEKMLLAAVRNEQADERKNSGRIRSLLGEMKLREGKDAEARDWFNKSLSVTTNNFPALIGLARLEGRQGHWEEMERYYTQAFAYTQNPAYLTEISYAQGRQNRASEAKNSLSNAGELLRKVLSQGEYGHGRDLARVFLLEGHPAEALPVLEKENLQRNDWKIKEVLGRTQMRLGHLKEARQFFKDAIATGLREPVLYELASQAAEADKDTAAAAQLREQLKAINPNFQAEWADF